MMSVSSISDTEVLNAALWRNAARATNQSEPSKAGPRATAPCRSQLTWFSPEEKRCADGDSTVVGTVGERKPSAQSFRLKDISLRVVDFHSAICESFCLLVGCIRNYLAYVVNIKICTETILLDLYFRNYFGAKHLWSGKKVC